VQTSAGLEQVYLSMQFGENVSVTAG